MEKLEAAFERKEAADMARRRKDAWREHGELVRGNPVRVYKGEKFIRIR